MSNRVLVFCGDKYHPSGIVMDGLIGACGDLANFEPAGEGTPTELDASVNAIVLAKSNASSPTDLSPWCTLEWDNRISEFVRSGKGLLVIHSGTVGYQSAPLIRSMTGGAFVRHPESCAVRLDVGSDGVLTSGVGSFSVFDEHYMMEFDEGQDVFLHSTSEHGVQPAGWSKTHGEGRVCVLTPGHFEEVWRATEFQRLLRNSLRWVIHE